MRLAAAVLFVSVVSVASVFAEGAPPLTPFRVGDRWGYVDPAGRVVIAPRFEEASRFTTDGLAAVRYNGAFGYVDPDGDLVIAPRFQAANAFSEGKAVVAEGDTLQVIDRSGRPLYPLEDLGVVGEYHDGRLLISRSGRLGFVDETGRLVVEPRYKLEGHSFSEGVASVRVEVRRGIGQDNFWVYIDREGREAIPQRFALALSFAEGIAPVIPLDAPANGRRWQYVDHEGQAVNTARFDSAFPFSEGLGRVAVFGGDGVGRYGFVDKSGRMVIPCRYDYASDFHEGLAAVQLGGKWGFIDRNGRAVVRPHFESAGDFAGGLAEVKVRVDGAVVTAFVNRRGKLVKVSSLP